MKKLNFSDNIKKKADEIFKGGKYQQAIDEYQKLIDLNPDNLKFQSICCSNISSCYSKLNKNDKALEFIKKATRLDPKYDKAFYRKGDIEKAMGNFVDAEESYRTA